MDGYLKIKTKIDNNGVDKDIADLENKIKKLQESNAEASKEKSSLQAEINNYEKLSQKAEEYKQKIKTLNEEKAKMYLKNGISKGLSDSQLPQFNQITSELRRIEAEYQKTSAELDKQSPKIDKVYAKLDKVKAKQTENNEKIKEFNTKINQINTSKVQNGLSSVGKELQNQIGKLGKMAFAIVGIRTAVGAVRSAISLVSQYNDQVSTDLEYMRYCIASLLVPAVQFLIRLLYTVLSYVNAITSAWFGINLFSNASAKNFQKMQSSASATAKSAKDMQKSLQGFDEMNVLQDNSDSSGDSGAGAGLAPSMDLSGLQGEVPEWLQWIIDNKDLITSVLLGIATGLVAIKLGLDPIKGLGLGLLIAGVVYTIQSLIEYLNDPSWENFGKILQGVGVAVIGLGLLIGSIPLAVTGAIILIVGTIVKYWDQIKAFFQGGIDWLSGKSDWVHEMFGDTIGNIYDTVVGALQLVLDIFDNVFTAIKGIFDGLIMFISGVFSGDWEKAWEGIKKIFSSIWEGLKGIVTSVWNFIKNLVINIATSVGNVISNVFKAIVNGILGAIESILNKPINTINTLIGVINKVPGINLGKLNTFKLPRMAKGGIISQPTQAIIGEAGTEAVMPLENNTEWIDLLADKLASKIKGGNGTVNVYLDGRLIQRQIAKREQELAFAKNGR